MKDLLKKIILGFGVYTAIFALMCGIFNWMLIEPVTIERMIFAYFLTTGVFGGFFLSITAIGFLMYFIILWAKHGVQWFNRFKEIEEEEKQKTVQQKIEEKIMQWRREWLAEREEELNDYLNKKLEQAGLV